MKTTAYTPATFKDYHQMEHDSCGVLSVMGKVRAPKKAYVEMVIGGLCQIEHRAGFVRGEGDGTGIHMDVPRALWKEKLMLKNVDGTLMSKAQFVVGHFFLTKSSPTSAVDSLKAQITQHLQTFGFELIFESDDETNSDALGPIGQQEEALFWQIGLVATDDVTNVHLQLFKAVVEIEKNTDIHVASLSPDYVVYKVLGDGRVLQRYYKDLQSPLIAATMILGHNRFSTNTASSFFRVQPFSIIGHNGEINTIERLRTQARLIDVPLIDNASDSQDLNRVLEGLLVIYGFNLFEAMDLIFPPIMNEVLQYSEELQALYKYLRRVWGHFAQGPAGIISRFGDEAVFSVDALGLRPLWQVETADVYAFSSEPGIVHPSAYVSEPKPFAPGEKVGLRYVDDKAVLYDYTAVQRCNYDTLSDRFDLLQPELTLNQHADTLTQAELTTGDYHACGWNQAHTLAVEEMAKNGTEPIRSLGYDTPLAALDGNRRNVADFLKETIAVVTNPAIDRDREVEHFSLRTIVGCRPSLTQPEAGFHLFPLESPIVVDQRFATGSSLVTYEQLIATLAQTATLSLGFNADSTLREGLVKLGESAVTAVQAGATVLTLDDTALFESGDLWMDAHLAVATVDEALTVAGLRRQCSLVVRAASIRSLHDIMLLFGLGAEVVNPYGMFQLAMKEEKGVEKLYAALTKGMSKVTSTMGIHELRGYGRLFSSIGLHPELAAILGIVNFFGSEKTAYSLTYLEKDAQLRQVDIGSESKTKAPLRTLMKIWKPITTVAEGGAYQAYDEKVSALEASDPSTIRHLLSFKTKAAVDPKTVNIGIKNHDLPFIISSMSFGSQGYVAFRAYAEAAQALNMISLNGEGGELPEFIGKYPDTRGIQVASGRFGVHADLLNSSNLIEIKISQGAKPGEGGHLPASKVTERIAEARHVGVGTDLLSPSNNHDIYSIEDLEQIITEIKTINPNARVAVKVAIVPNIGTIATGVVKAGADIVSLSGFDGGTGAARVHAITHAGLPVEIGVKAAHNALCEAGLRDQVELWADGGLRSADDALKLMLLGANRIGFGTVAMIAVGCTTCRGCHLDTCHVGIATQIETTEEAKARGLRRFVPRDGDRSTNQLINLFTTFGDALQARVAQLGYTDLQAIVGRSDLLEQVKGVELLDLNPLFTTVLAPEQLAEMKDQPTLEIESEDFGSVCVNNRVLVTDEVHLRIQNDEKQPLELTFVGGATPGNGFAAYNDTNIFSHVRGLAQDGVGKTSRNGGVYIMKETEINGMGYGGSVGKGFGYGAQAGSSLYVQGNADARAGIRLSGADMIIGGRLRHQIAEQEQGNMAINANIKGFAFEYMTGGRALVLGDPGPWICSGMTGGAVYLYHDPARGLTEAALRRRLAKGAQVILRPVTDQGIVDVLELITDYQRVLKENAQSEEAASLTHLMNNVAQAFYEVVPQ
ncbi:MAG: glutamate synthase-related protein [Defluviitaleaceae bacterium]|nr:glutamate synthase-related protein [Defluviitaleaceae bacterium]